MSYGRATSLSTGGMSLRRKAKTSMIKMAVKIVILCIFFFWVMPHYIATEVLGLTAQADEDNRFLLGIGAGVIAAPFMWFSDRIVEYQMGSR